MNAPEKFPSIRARLRAATDETHQALHRAAPFAAIADGTATLESYGRTLRFLHRFHSRLALLCARGARELGLPDLAAANAGRIAALEVDLQCLGVAISASHYPLRDSSPGFGAGAVYTVQGSTLGGKVIYRQLDALLQGDAGRSFFKGSPEDSRHWQSLCAALEDRGDDLAEMTAGALYAFACFEEAMTGAITPFPGGR